MTLKDELEELEAAFERDVRSLVRDELNDWFDYQLKYGVLRDILVRLDELEDGRGK